MDHERKGHFILGNSVRSKGESGSLSWPNWALSVRHNMSDSGMMSASCPLPDGPDMFYKDCSKWIMREKSTLYWGTQLGAREKVNLSLGPVGPCLLDTI